MRRPTEPLFLARETYRRRRLIDAVRLLPFLGAFVFLFPTLWGGAGGTLTGKLYLFFAWAVLIVLAALIARRLPANAPDDGVTSRDDEGR